MEKPKSISGETPPGLRLDPQNKSMLVLWRIDKKSSKPSLRMKIVNKGIFKRLHSHGLDASLQCVQQYKSVNICPFSIWNCKTHDRRKRTARQRSNTQLYWCTNSNPPRSRNPKNENPSDSDKRWRNYKPSRNDFKVHKHHVYLQQETNEPPFLCHELGERSNHFWNAMVPNLRTNSILEKKGTRRKNDTPNRI